MTLDPGTRQVYRRTDSATLVGLLPELRRLSKAVQKERERVQREPDVDSADDQFPADLAAYEALAMQCEAWIRDELKRRGLLPLWPGEEVHLDQDA